MNHRINSRKLPKCIEQLAKEGYIIDIEHCKKLIRITCEGSSLRNLNHSGRPDYSNLVDDMGRTVPSFRMLLEEIVMELSVFKRALRGEDKIVFDNQMNKARQHSSSCTVTPMLEPMDAVFVSILVEHEKEISSLKEVSRGHV